MAATTPAMLADAIRTVHGGNAVLAPSDLSALFLDRFAEPTPPPAAYSALTEKEREVFHAVVRGLSNAEIAAEVTRARERYGADSKLAKYIASERGRNFVRSTLRRTAVVEKLVDDWLAAHPDHPARPSQYDLDHAWPFFSYVIVSVHEGVPQDMTSWLLQDDRSAFSEETLTHGD